MAIHYKLTKAVAETILGLPGAEIFGGYVRDTILHDHHAKVFYAKRTHTDNYADPECLPETVDRLLVPNDIDCFMRTDDLPSLIKEINDSGLSVFSRSNTTPLSNYISGIQEGHPLSLTKLRVGLKMTGVLAQVVDTHLKNIVIHVDVVHGKDIRGMDPPFGMVDFECNALILSKSGGIRVSDKMFTKHCTPLDRFEVLSRIVNDIKAKRAVGCVNVPGYRIQKMLSKGWVLVNNIDIGFSKGIELFPPAQVDKDDMCILCLAEFKKKPALKRGCCAAKYHPRCYKNLVEHKSFGWHCPMCRDEIDSSEVHKRTIKFW